MTSEDAVLDGELLREYPERCLDPEGADAEE
jgi:hypothetical protein